MKSLYILTGVVLLIVLFYPQITISENQIYSPLNNSSQKLSTPRMYDFYIPQLTNSQTPLSSSVSHAQGSTLNYSIELAMDNSSQQVDWYVDNVSTQVN